MISFYKSLKRYVGYSGLPRSLKGVPIKYPLVATVPNSGIYFLDPPVGLGLKYHAIAVNASS